MKQVFFFVALDEPKVAKRSKKTFSYLFQHMIGFGSNSNIVPSESNELSYKKAHNILASQRLSSVLKLKNGEQITYAEVGDRNGIPCFWIGGPCSNRMIIALYNDMCVEMGIRLISFDRPGRGGSSPIQNPKEWTFSKYAGKIKLTRLSQSSFVFIEN